MIYSSYKQYKDSGLKLIGMVPAHWQVSPLKWHIVLNDGGVWGEDDDGENSTIVLRSTEQTLEGYWKIDDPAMRKLGPLEKTSCLLSENDLLVTKSSGSKLHIGKTTLVTETIAALKCCYSNFMQRIRTKSSLHPKLVWYIMNNSLTRLQFDLLSTSSTGLANLNANIIGQVLIPIPSANEQSVIVSFLDRETSKIDTLIAEQERLIELLKEKRNITISNAVSKGLNPKASMKDSGIEWLGRIPRHWKVIRLRFVLELNPSKSEINQVGKDTLVSFLPMDNINVDGTLCLNQEKKIQEVESGYTFFRNGDVTIAKITPCFENGKRAVMQNLTNGIGFGTTELIVARPIKDTISAQYLHSIFSSLPFMSLGKAHMYGAGGQKRVPDDFILNFQIGIPSIDEQNVISKYLETKTAKIDSLINESKKAVELLQERRRAMIFEAVTGKIDVRNVID